MNILEKMVSKPLESLKVLNKKLPNREVLILYREVLKFTNEFYWYDERGRLWKEILRESARKEFEMAKSENDFLYLNKMLITSRHSMEKLREKLIDEYVKNNKDFHLKATILRKQMEHENKGKHKAKDYEFNSIFK